MVRKQLYLNEAQDKALKRRAKELGVSEAEVVRNALEAALFNRSALRKQHLHIDTFLRRAGALAQTHPPAESYRFDRQALYEEDNRFKRWQD